jgi:hypothetical protein
MMFLAGFLSAFLLMLARQWIDSKPPPQHHSWAPGMGWSKGTNEPTHRAKLFNPESDEDRLKRELIDRNAQSGQGTPLDQL